MIVYKTTNLLTNKSYVGKDAHNRSKYLGGGLYLSRAIKRYGKENFLKETLAWCYTKEHLDWLEKFYIQYFNTKVPNGYNISDGGDGGKTGVPGWSKGLTKETDERIAKYSKALTGKKHSKERREHERVSHLGLTLSTESRIKLSKSLKAKFEKDGHHMNGKRLPAEWKANIGKGHIGLIYKKEKM
jgi:group I intron endonuclease